MFVKFVRKKREQMDLYSVYSFICILCLDAVFEIEFQLVFYWIVDIKNKQLQLIEERA